MFVIKCAQPLKGKNIQVINQQSTCESFSYIEVYGQPEPTIIKLTNANESTTRYDQRKARKENAVLGYDGKERTFIYTKFKSKTGEDGWWTADFVGGKFAVTEVKILNRQAYPMNKSVNKRIEGSIISVSGQECGRIT